MILNYFWIIWRIVLDDPVDQWNVETARCHVRAKQYARLGVGELEKGLRALCLLLLAMNGHDGQVDVVEQFVVVFDAHARAEEDHHFFLAILLEEREEKEESLLGRNDHVALFEALNSGIFLMVVDANVDGLLLERQLGQIVCFGRQRCREKYSLTLFF